MSLVLNGQWSSMLLDLTFFLVIYHGLTRSHLGPRVAPGGNSLRLVDISIVD